MKYNIHYDIAALVLAVIILIHFQHKKSIKTAQTYVFTGLLWLCLITDLMDMLTVVLDEWRLDAPVVVAANLVYLITFNTLPFMYYLYLLQMTKSRDTWRFWDKLILYAPVVWTILLILTSPFTRLIFYYNTEEGYCHGAGFWMLYIATGIYMAMSLFAAIRYHEKLTSWQQTSVYCYLFASFAGIILQVLLPGILTLQFAVTLSLLVLYMSLENPDDDEDKRLGVFNRRGFDKLIAALTGKTDEFYVIIATITNVQSIREVAGAEVSLALVRQLVDRLRPEIRPAELCYLSEGRLAVIVDKKKGVLNRAVSGLQKVLAETVTLGDMNIQLETLLLQLDYPDEVKTAEDIMDFIDYSAGVPFESSGGEIVHASSDILKSKRRENRILQIMQQALMDGAFQVYYQPIYSAREKRFNSAEALIRLIDDEMGFISPEEFIPMAEKNGMILKIGEFVFRTVCDMMAREKIWEKGIDYIEVNLSVIQCMQEDICEMLYGIMDEYEIPYSRINLEVTETILARDILWGTMERMTVGGVTFSLDDYGTGYANLTNIIKYPFHIVKLDKSMVWYAMENQNALRTLRHTVAMIQDMGMHIVAEGVETKEQLDILTEMGCEYMQGYYFSKPVPEKDFLARLDRAV